MRGRIANLLASARSTLSDRPTTPRYLRASSTSRPSPTHRIQLNSLEFESSCPPHSLSEESQKLLSALEASIAELDPESILGVLTRMLEYQQQLLSVFQVADVNRLLQSLVRVIESIELKEAVCLAHVHLLRVLLHSHELDSTSVMRSVFSCVQYLHSHRDEVPSLVTPAFECLHDCLLTWTSLAREVQSQLDQTDVSEGSLLYLRSVILCLDAIASMAEENSSLFSSLCRNRDTEQTVLNLARSLNQLICKPTSSSPTLLDKSLYDCLIACNQCIKELSVNDESREKLMNLSALSVLSEQLKPISSSSSKLSDLQIQLALSTLRLTSRFSLQEGFRFCINNDKELLRNFARIFHYLQHTQVDLSQSLSSSSIKEKHFLPVLSHLAFTLGNLTTTNSKNRRILGLNCDTTSSLLHHIKVIFIVLMFFFLPLLDTIAAVYKIFIPRCWGHTTITCGTPFDSSCAISIAGKLQY